MATRRAKALSDHTTCPRCGKTVRLRVAGQFKGQMYKHMSAGFWCVEPEPNDESVNLAATTTGFVYNSLADEILRILQYRFGAYLLTHTPQMPVFALAVDDLLAAFEPYLRKGSGIGGSARERLATWWRDTAEDEIAMVVDKAIEYGATDLRDIGRALLEMAGRTDEDGDEITDAYAAELGIAFYILGKVSRVIAAVKEGRRPSGDTWVDIGVYARMAQRVQQVGSWPGVG